MRTILRISLGLLIVSVAPSSIQAQNLPPIDDCPVAVSGDVNCSGDLGLADVVYIVNYVFRGGDPPCPHFLVADVDVDGNVNVIDIIALVNYFFRGGPPPTDICAAYFGDYDLALEAELMAMSYGGEVWAPEELKWLIYVDLNRIRTNFRDSIPEVDSVGFVPPWFFGKVSMRVDSATFAAMEAGAYTAWDSLNSLYQPLSIDFVAILGVAELTFYDNMNAAVLSEMYAQLPGVLYAHPDRWLGDWPCIYRLSDGDVAAYFFRQAWGDCPSGCIYTRSWYFLATSAQIQYKGYAEPPDIIPGWWPILVAARDAYWQL